MNQWREDRIGSALRGENPTVLARMPGGFAVMGDSQWLPGYCVLLTDNPKAVAFLHAHVWPRYEWEPPEFIHRPVWLYPLDKWRDEASALGNQHKVLRVAIMNYLTSR